MKNLNLPQLLLNAQTYTVISNGESLELKDAVFLQHLKELLIGAYFSPSFAKFNHDNVEMKKSINLWLELSYDKPQEYAEYPFEKLLIHLEPDLEEIIIIRKHNNVYQEKGYLLILNNSTKPLYRYLLKLTQPNRAI